MKKTALPSPSPAMLAHSEQLVQLITAQMQQSKPVLPFVDFMQQALYMPNLGYYSAGLDKLGKTGDFVTAPEISPLFSQCIANQCQQVLSSLENGVILEFGAGSGIMAADILNHLDQLQCLPQYYYIVEVSADLKQRQQTTLKNRLSDELFTTVQWISRLPEEPMQAVILANEVLDAMPVHKFRVEQNYIAEFYVSYQNEQFEWQILPTQNTLLQTTVDNLRLPIGYVSEVNLLLEPWIKAMANILEKGLVLLIDYGFLRSEYYHPQRNEGTLMCHYQHHAHTDPLILVGLQDITAHVDFTAVFDVAQKNNLQIAGYTQQANFLLASGLLNNLTQYETHEINAEYFQLSQQVKTLTLPSEMGELFKVMALTRELDLSLIGFS